MSENGRAFQYLGTPMPVLEDRRFVRGRGRYIADLELPGMLHIAVVSSPVAHARLGSVDVSAALTAPGVVTALTGSDLVERMEAIPQELEIPGVRWYPLAVDKIRFAGEWVAAIVATSRAAAEDAAELVDFEYDELLPVVDPEAALRPDAPVLHEAHGSNVVWQDTVTWGDVDGAFAAAAHVFEYRYRWHRHSGVPLETFGCVAAPQPNGTLDIWASHQNPGIQQEMMDVLRLPSARVHMDVDVGGSYGSKRGRKQMYLTAVAALVTDRPVRFIEDRVENMQSSDGHGPDRVYGIRVAAGADGVLDAIDVTIVEDLGAYCGRGPRQILKPTAAVVGPYRIRNVRYGGYGVLTCKTNQVPFRGAGQSPHNFLIERSVDQVARELGIDRVEIRRRNYIRADEFPYEIPSGAKYDSGDYAGAMDLAIENAGLEALRAEQAAARAEGRLVGIGVAGAIEPSGGIADPEGARLQVDEQGRLVATIGFQSSGQSHESMVTQIICEELGVRPGDVVVQRANGMGGIVGGATTGSRMTRMLDGALHHVSGKVREKLRRLAAHVLEVAPDDVVVDGTRYHVAGAPTRGKDLKELAAIAYTQRDLLPPGTEGGVVEDMVYWGPDGVRARKGGRAFPSYAFDFHIPVVEVDPETFEIRFLRYVVVHDCGTVLNPLVVDGFVYGGIGHGIGGALYEHFAYDEQGVLRAATFMDYLMPTAAEIPHVELHSMETPTPLHPYGAKGTAEGAYMTAPAAVASAVEDALAPLGVRIDEVPITPVLLLDHVERAREGRTAAGPAAVREP
jgi:CO/xanthine dehydrogenase Mo-binding subunit